MPFMPSQEELPSEKFDKKLPALTASVNIGSNVISEV